MFSKTLVFFTLPLLSFLSACGGDQRIVVANARYSVGGTVTGLFAGTLVLQNNSQDDLTLSSDGSFTFATSIENGSFNVTVKTQPDGQTCIITNGSGQVLGEDISNISISCPVILSYGGLSATASDSGLSIKNTSTSAITVKGIYFTSLDLGAATPCFGAVVAGANIFGGTWTKIDIPASKLVNLDRNFLYNAMANFLHQLNFIIGPPPVATPGGTAAWCVRIGLSTSNPVSQMGVDPSPLIDDAFNDAEEIILQCDDLAATCETTSEITQEFPK
jgi:hypothetical protein